jgi:hypothetical protein
MQTIVQPCVGLPLELLASARFGSGFGDKSFQGGLFVDAVFAFGFVSRYNFTFAGRFVLWRFFVVFGSFVLAHFVQFSKQSAVAPRWKPERARFLWAMQRSGYRRELLLHNFINKLQNSHIPQIDSSPPKRFIFSVLKWEGVRPVTFLNWLDKCATLL